MNQFISLLFQIVCIIMLLRRQAYFRVAEITEYSLFHVGEVLSFENFIYSIFEFITALVETPRFKKTVKDYLEDIMLYTMIYMQIREEQVRK